MQGKIVSWEILPPAPLEKGRETVQWMATASKIAGDLFMVRLIANLPPGKMLCSQSTESGGGICPTEISFKQGDGISVTGDCSEKGGKLEAFDEYWAVYPDRKSRISYKQFMKLSDDRIRKISGTVKYQVLSKNSVLDAKTTEFSIPIKH